MVRKSILKQIGLESRFKSQEGRGESYIDGEGVIERGSNKFKRSSAILIGADARGHQEL